MGILEIFEALVLVKPNSNKMVNVTDVQWRDDIENLNGLRICAIIQLIFGVLSLASACTSSAADNESALSGPQGAAKVKETAQKSSKSSSFVIGLTTGILGV